VKLSTRGEYGLRAMFDLAMRQGEGPIPLKDIAERQAISGHYLEQLIAGLRKAGLVKSVRGAQGGYMLGRSPEEITVGDIVRVLEGPIGPTECVSEDDAAYCDRSETCIARRVWARVRDSIVEVMDSITLKDMCAEAEKIAQESKGNMYYI
jgi:Rrf2 family cysteine metabolism transcriptional repressor